MISFYYFNWFGGIPATGLLHLILSNGYQSTIITKLSRQSHGFAWGIIITICGTFYLFVLNHLKWFYLWFYLATFFFIIISITFYLSSIILPNNLNHLTSNIDTR